MNRFVIFLPCARQGITLRGRVVKAIYLLILVLMRSSILAFTGLHEAKSYSVLDIKYQKSLELTSLRYWSLWKELFFHWIERVDFNYKLRTCHCKIVYWSHLMECILMEITIIQLQNSAGSTRLINVKIFVQEYFNKINIYLECY